MDNGQQGSLGVPASGTVRQPAVAGGSLLPDPVGPEIPKPGTPATPAAASPTPVSPVADAPKQVQEASGAPTPGASPTPVQQTVEVEQSTGSAVITDHVVQAQQQAAQSEDLLKEVKEREAKKAEKKPSLMEKFKNLDKKVKRRLIIGGSLGVVAFIGIILMVVLMANRIDYSTAYKTAKELKTEVQAMKSDYDCDKVVDYVESTYTTMRTYNDYVEGCKDLGETAGELTTALGKTDGVVKDEVINRYYNTFVTAFNEATSGGEKLNATLQDYAVWHNWTLSAYELDSWDQTDADLSSAAKILTSSSNELFATYGEGWLPLKQAVAKAYREYYASNILADNRTELYNAMVEAQKAFTNWDAENKPNIKEELPLERPDMANMVSKFEEMYNMIKDSYQKHYNSGSGDCTETLSAVVCE